jgi:hypothetical protein
MSLFLDYQIPDEVLSKILYFYTIPTEWSFKNGENCRAIKGKA